MELFRSETYYIFVKNESSLLWNRITGAFSVRSAWDLSDIEDIECLGITEGIIGKVEYSNIFEPRLIIIKESIPVGQIYFHHTIYKIKSICILNMGPVNQEVELCNCTKHGSINSITNSVHAKRIGSKLFENSAFLNKTVGAVKNVSNTIKSTTQQAATQVKQTVKKQRDPKEAERFEKRLTDELHKIFDDTDSFYYSRTLDLTNSLQRQYEVEKILQEAKETTRPITDTARWWRYVDDRFFWNKHMLKDIIALESPNCDQWILPIIQGYVHLSQIAVDSSENNPLNTESLTSSMTCDETFTLGLISRRSRYQAGTRYNRRGIEPNGKVANYVETEQIVSIVCSDSIHRTSFVQVRGSVPIFWSQPEYKFRPPPRLDKGEEETHEAFKKHFVEELKLYQQVCIVNLVEQQGREKVIWETYGDHVLKYNNPDIIYATFDFHEYCRGMHYENVSILINALAEIINDMGFCWRDDRGLICSQNGVFRVNCIDCLDRTNVVQTAIAKYVLELQLCRLGLGAPGSALPPALRRALLAAWADNGDLISRQYAGTKALKGDYTRTGERKFTGMMKDGMASANRYYLSTFKDALRQAAIDVMTGESKAIPEQLIVPCSSCSPQKLAVFNVMEQSSPDMTVMAEHVKSLIDDCKKLLIDTEPVLGSWGLIDADPNTGDPHETEMDCIVVLTAEAYYVVDYDSPSDRLMAVQRVPLRDIISIELGTLESNITLFGVGRKSGAETTYSIRINYLYNNEPGYFHMFRSTSLRFFNNMAIAITTRDEMIESLHSICESILVARDILKLAPIPFLEGGKLDKKKSKVHPGQGIMGGARTSPYLDLSHLPTLTKNVSETQLVADIRSVGSKALTNMSEQFSKLNKLGHSLNTKARPKMQLRFDQNSTRTRKLVTLAPKENEKKKGSFSDGLSSDYSSDDDRPNIFEPTLDNFENMQHYIGKDKSSQEHNDIENDCDLIENPLYTSKIEPNEMQDSLMTDTTNKQSIKTPINMNKKNPFDSESETKAPPTILVETGEAVYKNSANPLILNQKLSHSSSDLSQNDQTSSDLVRSSSRHSITLNITQSHSESALKQLKSLASPVTGPSKDVVLSPLTKLAKGMQSLGANLDPRKIKGSGTVRHITEEQYEERKQLQEKWQGCNTRLIAL